MSSDRMTLNDILIALEERPDIQTNIYITRLVEKIKRFSQRSYTCAPTPFKLRAITIMVMQLFSMTDLRPRIHPCEEPPVTYNPQPTMRAFRKPHATKRVVEISDEELGICVGGGRQVYIPEYVPSAEDVRVPAGMIAPPPPHWHDLGSIGMVWHYDIEHILTLPNSVLSGGYLLWLMNRHANAEYLNTVEYTGDIDIYTSASEADVFRKMFDRRYVPKYVASAIHEQSQFLFRDDRELHMQRVREKYLAAGRDFFAATGTDERVIREVFGDRNGLIREINRITNKTSVELHEAPVIFSRMRTWITNKEIRRLDRPDVFRSYVDTYEESHVNNQYSGYVICFEHIDLWGSHRSQDIDVIMTTHPKMSTSIQREDPREFIAIEFDLNIVKNYAVNGPAGLHVFSMFPDEIKNKQLRIDRHPQMSINYYKTTATASRIAKYIERGYTFDGRYPDYWNLLNKRHYKHMGALDVDYIMDAGLTKFEISKICDELLVFEMGHYRMNREHMEIEERVYFAFVKSLAAKYLMNPTEGAASINRLGQILDVDVWWYLRYTLVSVGTMADLLERRRGDIIENVIASNYSRMADELKSVWQFYQLNHTLPYECSQGNPPYYKEMAMLNKYRPSKKYMFGQIELPFRYES